MPSYTILKKGDRLPTVGVLQALLNRTGATLEPDGIFGPRTESALIEFQRARRLDPSGVAVGETWRRLMFQTQVPVIDFVDVFHDMVYEKAMALTAAGGSPMMMGGMSNAVLDMATQLSALHGVFLLRIIGHGGPGIQAIAMGKGGYYETVKGRSVRRLYPHETSSFSIVNLRTIPGHTFGRIFGPYGCLEMHGCHVAQGATGRAFVTRLANLVGVPVSAALGSQQSPFRLDGATFTAVPRGRSLEEWCSHLPPFAPMSVP
jgi:peptidoglycan hydrolase-like protein with peptidoglycan-binding domain